jgi:death-on-curing family protein
MKKPSEDSPQPKTIWVDIKDFEFLCFNLAIELLTFSEPIPDYSTRNNSLLDSALASPKHTFCGKLLYPTLVEQASILFYSLIKNHPFLNGNKRISVMTLLIFLSLNGKWIKISPRALYKLANITSASNSKSREIVLKGNTEIIKKYLIDLPLH